MYALKEAFEHAAVLSNEVRSISRDRRNGDAAECMQTACRIPRAVYAGPVIGSCRQGRDVGEADAAWWREEEKR